MNQFPSKNFFTLPNEIFSLGLGAGEIAVYAYLRCLENPSTYHGKSASPSATNRMTMSWSSNRDFQ